MNSRTAFALKRALAAFAVVFSVMTLLLASYGDVVSAFLGAGICSVVACGCGILVGSLIFHFVRRLITLNGLVRVVSAVISCGLCVIIVIVIGQYLFVPTDAIATMDVFALLATAAGTVGALYGSGYGQNVRQLDRPG